MVWTSCRAVTIVWRCPNSCWMSDASDVFGDFAALYRAHLDSVELMDLRAQLPGDQRSAVQARVVDEQAYAEIALSSGVSQAAVRKRVSRGLATLRGCLSREER
jgi:DNA-directed RNA polymerase specialized sigma24 family protein